MYVCMCIYIYIERERDPACFWARLYPDRVSNGRSSPNILLNNNNNNNNSSSSNNDNTDNSSSLLARSGCSSPGNSPRRILPSGPAAALL